MRPAQIRVFDGLRITTDHVNHLQGALSSGFEDLREILGLGRPQTGLAVSIADDGTATIQTGTAFDEQKNRVACDTPLTVKVLFGDKDTCKFICLKYEQVEDTAVEGHPTMIWDSCSALVRDTWPDPKENLVTVAKVEKGADGKLHVHPAHERRDYHAVSSMPVPPSAAANVPTVPPPDPATAASVAETSPPEPVATPSTPPEPSTAAPVTPAAPDAGPGGVKFQQGVLQLASDPAAASFLRMVAAPALRAKISSGPMDLSFTLSQAQVVPEIAVASFSTQCVLSGDLTFPAADAQSPQPRFAFECMSNGEATSVSTGLIQFAAGSIYMRPMPATPGTVWPTTVFAGGALGEFPFAKWSDAPDASRPPLPADVLAGLSLLAQLAPAAQGFVLVVKLSWSGTVSDASLKVLETQDIPFAWQVSLGWKAVGN